RCYSGPPQVGINRASLLLDHDRTRHLRVNGAKIGVSARGARSDSEFLVGVEGRGFLKLLLYADDRVRFVVAINPGDLFARLHGQSLGIEGEVFDLYSVLLRAVGVLHFAAEREEGQIEKSDAAQERRD